MGEDTEIWLRGEDSPPRPPSSQSASPWPHESGADQKKAHRSWVGDRYRIDDTLADTPASFVYKAHDVWQNIDVVIKEMRRPSDCDQEEWKELLIRFEKSASIGHHPYIVEILNYQIRDDVPFLVMEYVAGGDLDDRLYGRKDPHGNRAPQDGPLTLAEIREVMDSLFAGLDFTHSRGIVHRDIKPANILHSSTSRWKLTDFGIARFRSSVHTQHRAFIGTPAYSSPEQVIGDAVDERTDIYSCGVVLYEMLAGLRPFRGSSETVRRLILEGKPLAPSLARTQLARVGEPAISDALDRVVARAMAVDRSHRYQTVQDFRDALHQALGHQRQPEPPPTGSVGSSRSSGRSFDSGETVAQTYGRWRLSQPGWEMPAPRPKVSKPKRRLGWLIGVSAFALLGLGISVVALTVFRDLTPLPFPTAPPPTPKPVDTIPTQPPRVPPTVETQPPVPLPLPAPKEPPYSPPETVRPPAEVAPPAPAPSDGNESTNPVWSEPTGPEPWKPVLRQPPPGNGGGEPGVGTTRPLPFPPSDGNAGSRPTVPTPVKPWPAPEQPPAPPVQTRPGPSRPAYTKPPEPPTGFASRPSPGSGTAVPNAPAPMDTPAVSNHFLPANPYDAPPSAAPAETRPASRPQETGMTCRVLTPEEAASRNITGVTAPLLLIEGVANGSAGYAAGIERFDVVQKKGGIWLRSDGLTFSGCVAYPPAGTNSISVSVWRNGRWQSRTLRWS